MFTNDAFNMSLFGKMSYPELITWLLGTATLQERHHFHGGTMPDWVPAWVRFRQHADTLTKTTKAAENKDTVKARERDQEHANTLLSINTNACYVVMRAQHEKDETLLHNMGYEVKEKAKRNQAGPSISRLPLKIRVKRGPTPGSVVLTFEKDPAAGLYQLQICKGEPTGEESWGDHGNYKKCRIHIENLDRASWYYFRFRSHGDNESSPWSAPVGIIVV